LAVQVGGGQPARVVEVVLELVLELVLDDEDDEDDAAVVEVVDERDVVVVAPIQLTARVKLEANGQPELHAAPAGQHVRLEPVPHGVVLAGQPQKERDESMQATPLLQHACPHGVVPFGQQHPVAGDEHVSPFWQHPLPQAGPPSGQVTAALRNGRSSVAPAVATNVAPTSFNAPRREVGAAIARLRSSNPSLTAPPPNSGQR
jgi:hypothetical protein